MNACRLFSDYQDKKRGVCTNPTIACTAAIFPSLNCRSRYMALEFLNHFHQTSSSRFADRGEDAELPGDSRNWCVLSMTDPIAKTILRQAYQAGSCEGSRGYERSNLAMNVGLENSGKMAPKLLKNSTLCEWRRHPSLQ